MLSRKIDVDRHVEYTIKRIQSESERNLRSYAFAKLYYNVSEYEQARRYVSNYLIVKPKSAEGHLLLGNILEKLGRREAALEAYRTSLDIDPKQNGLVLKVCELLASDDITLDSSRARYWCEQARLLDPQHPAVFDLRERLATAESAGPEDVLQLFISELENRPTDIALRVRLLQHMLEYNKLKEAYQHVSEIERKNLPIFAEHLVWYETVAKILVRYKNENANNSSSLTWQFWMLIISVFDKLVSLSLDENVSTSKNLSDCVRSIFTFDQTLSVAADNINSQCMEKQLTQEFLIHYRAQLCFHIGTLVFKQAKKDQIKYKEAMNLAIPLFLISYHSQPIELQCVWLEHAPDSTRKLAQRWNREASFRCSQAGHTIQSLIRERRSTFADRVSQLCSGNWRERTYKNIFITRDQQQKMKTSYFVNCLQLDDIVNRLPDSSELLRYDEIAQLLHPNSLHHIIWIGLNIPPVKFRCTVFDGLQYSVKNLSNCAAETLNFLDIQAFLYCCIFCVQANIEESKHLIYYNQEKPTMLPACITEPFGTLNQTKWFSCVYKMYSNESGSDLSDIRITLIKGIEIVRCAGAHGLDVKLLVMLANTFAQKAKLLTKSTEIEYTETRAELYWKTALPYLEKLRNNQNITYPVKRWFEYRGKEMTPTEIHMYIEEGKLFSAVQLMKKKEHEKALQMLESLKNPYASFYQAQTYKLLADEQMSHNKENVTSEMRSQHIILLSKARDCFYLTLDRLREPSVDRKHPLNIELGTEIEKIERLLSRIDPDICANRNECDGMSDENVSSVGSVGEHVNVNSSSFLNNYHFGNLSTPRHDHNTMTSTSFRIGGIGAIGDSSMLNSSTRRAEARPSPERLDAQLRQMIAAKDATLQHIIEQNRQVMDAHRTLLDELRGFKDAVQGLTTSVDELRTVKKSVEDFKVGLDDLQNMKEQVYEIKKDLAELKKDTNKLKSNQINDEDLYALEEEYGVDYNINAANAGTSFNSAASLYPNFPQRLQGAAAAAAANTLAYGAPGLYGMYPMYPPYGGLSLGQPAAIPFADGVGSHVPDFRTMGSIAQGLSHAGLSNQPPQQATPVQLGNANMFGKITTPECAGSYMKYDNSLNNVTGAPLLIPNASTSQAAPISITPTTTCTVATNIPVNKAPPVNVVITASDPLPTTTSTTQAQVLSVTIPPQHLKGNQKPHNYQIPLPTSSQPSFANVQSAITQTPMPVATQNLLSNISPPVYSSLTVKSPGQPTNNSHLGLQIEKSLAQSFISTPNSSLIEQQKSDLNKSNTSEASILEEHDPCPDFKPIIPLPDEVPLNTGEENEKVLFCEHAKLFRFVEKEWRERGIGHIKILYNEVTGKVRILMRRDQVHKICANHFITHDIQLTPMSKNERAYIWAANDFADENVVLEKLCVRFKTVEEAKKFAAAFEKAKDLSKPTSTPIKTTNTVTVDGSKSICNVQSKLENSANKENSLGGFVFTSTPTFKPKSDLLKDAFEGKKTDTSSKTTSPFVGFSFGLQQKPQQSTPTTVTDFKPLQKANDSIKIAADSSQHHGNDDETDDDFVPTTEFKPVIPLPDLIEVKTGEENSEVLYEVKAKLLRFDSASKEWKERGIGYMKILKDKTIRLLMRREQVHKVCCNHQLLKSMVFTNMPKNNRVLNWCAQDYSENVLKTEMFAIRFRTPELCEEFLQMIHKSQDMLDSSNNVISGSTIHNVGQTEKAQNSSAWGEAFKKKEGQWECSACYINNDSSKDSCIACGTSRGGYDNSKSENAQSPQKFKPSPASTTQPIKENKPKMNTWQCKVCFIHNDGKNKNCEACDTPKNDSVTKKDELNTSGQQFSFGVPSPKFNSNISNTTSNWGDLYKPKAGVWNCQGCYLSNDSSALYCAACESPKDDTIPKKENKGLDLGVSSEQKFTFGIPVSQTKTATTSLPLSTTTTTESSVSTIFGFKSQPSAGFTFGMQQNTANVVTPKTGFTFGAQKTTTETTTAPLNLAAKPTFSFTMPTNTTNTQSGITPPKTDEFVFGSPSKHEFEFKPRSPRKVSGCEDDSDGSCIEEECDNIYFKPVIPLPDKVEVKTGEEGEEVLYCHRAKLFRFVNSEWKERGIGDVKILRDPSTKKLRIVMRREQVHKICLNHILTKEIDYKPKDEKTWLFSAPDFSEGTVLHQQFCIRFKSSEIAKEFYSAIEKARNDTNSTTIPKTEILKSNTSENHQSDNDIEIVYETQVPLELQEKALALKLPKNFYAYLQKPPCKGCIGCNDDNFVFSSSSSSSNKNNFDVKSTPTTAVTSAIGSVFGTPKTTSGLFGTPQTTTTPSVFGTPQTTTTTPSVFGTPQTTTTTPSVFGTPQSTTFTANMFGTPQTTTTSYFGTPQQTNIFSGSSSTTPVFGTPKSTSFNFTQQQQQTNDNNTKTFSSPFSFVPATTSNIFGTAGSVTFGSTTITPVKNNNSPTLTNLLTQPSQQSKEVSSSTEQHKSPLAPSKLANALCVTTQSASIFGGGSPSTTTTTTANIFGGNKTQNTENLSPLTQLLTTNKNISSSVSIFGGAKNTTTATPIFGASNQNSNIFGGGVSTTTTLFGSTIPKDNASNSGVKEGTIFGSLSQKNVDNQQTTTIQKSGSIFGNLPATVPTFGSLAAANKTSDTATTENKGEIKSFTFAGTGAPVFGNQTKETEPVLKCDTNLSFAALASNVPAFTTKEEKTETKSFTFAGAGSQVFGSKKTPAKTDKLNKTNEDESVTNEGDEEAGADSTEPYDPHYDPIVPLPEAIVVKTGEEDETIMFNERAKLYRYAADTKEWKERGVGQIKLLYHPVNGTYRLLLRREQVHKLVLNQLVTTDMDLQQMQTSDCAWLWAGYNYTEDGNQLEKLAVRFKNAELAVRFHQAVQNAQEFLRSKPTIAIKDVEKPTEPNNEVEEDDEDDEDDEEEEDEHDIEDDEEYNSDESDDNKSIMFSKRCTLSYKTDESSEWIVLGMGPIKMFYDSEMYGGRIEMCDDTGKQLSNTIIAINTVMKVEDTCCIWRAMEWNLNPSEPRILRAQFSSNAAAQEMYYNYEESLQYAQHSEIIDTLPE